MVCGEVGTSVCGGGNVFRSLAARHKTPQKQGHATFRPQSHSFQREAMRKAPAFVSLSLSLCATGIALTNFPRAVETVEKCVWH